jgi:hypothetical protein
VGARAPDAGGRGSDAGGRGSDVGREHEQGLLLRGSAGCWHVEGVYD